MGHRGTLVEKQVFEVNWEAGQAEKNGYDHFMLKEIHEQPRAMRDTLSSRIAEDGRSVVLNEISLDPQRLREINKIFITACGTAYHAGMVGA